MTHDERDMIVQMECSALMKVGYILDEEWFEDADLFVEGEIDLDAWKARNEARFTHEGLEVLFNEETR